MNNSNANTPGMAQSLEPLVQSFLLAKKLELRRASSFRDLNYFLRRVCAGLVSQYPDLNFEQLNASQLRQLIHWWEGDASGFTTNRATIKKMVMYLKYFCRWCREEGLTETNPAEKLRYLSGCHYDKTPLAAGDKFYVTVPWKPYLGYMKRREPRKT